MCWANMARRRCLCVSPRICAQHVMITQVADRDIMTVSGPCICWKNNFLPPSCILLPATEFSGCATLWVYRNKYGELCLGWIPPKDNNSVVCKDGWQSDSAVYLRQWIYSVLHNLQSPSTRCLAVSIFHAPLNDLEQECETCFNSFNACSQKW